MNHAEELAAIDRIRDKQKRGEKLTDKEETLLAYSSYGAGSSCSCQRVVIYGKEEE